jgi:hypothetical protein
MKDLSLTRATFASIRVKGEPQEKRLTVLTGPGASIESLKLKESEKDDARSGERRIGEEVSWKGDSGRLERGRVEGPGMRKGWRGMRAELDDLLYRKRR